MFAASLKVLAIAAQLSNVVPAAEAEPCLKISCPPPTGGGGVVLLRRGDNHDRLMERDSVVRPDRDDALDKLQRSPGVLDLFDHRR